MSRATLAAWHSRPGGDWLAPQRTPATVGALDRRLAVLLARLALWLGAYERYTLKRFSQRVLALAPPLQALDEAGLREQGMLLRARMLREGLTPDLTAQAFALASEASARRLGKRPYASQLQGGYGVLRGRLVEMATGEGKTLTALLPALALAMAGIPVHVITVNPYLTRRDAAYVAPVLELFGYSVGVVTHEEDDDAKRAAYRANVTYCVNKDVVFDYLRDSLKPATAADQRCQRGLYFALVDEADGILVDEARTPLVIARELPMAQEKADSQLALALARALQPEHYRAAADGRQYSLTAAGQRHLQTLEAQWQAGGVGWQIARLREERTERALNALYAFHRGSQYVVQDDKVHIVDEFTGRILPDRTWERGLHQMIELKEGLQVTAPRDTIARQTYPEFFARYLRIAGMTGTGREVAGEIKANFGSHFVAIPTNRPCRRRFLGARLYGSADARWQAIAVQAIALAAQGRAVLVGTRSVQASQELSAVLTAAGQPHAVLNALQDQREAEIVAGAGQPGQVTVATNMAGRGTDIELAAAVRAAGGLHVILSEFHESRRIDRQLYGRAGRQGDPGSCEAIISLDDEIFVQFAPLFTRLLRLRYAAPACLPALLCRTLINFAQWRAERRNAAVRHHAAEHAAAMARATAFSGPGS